MNYIGYTTDLTRRMREHELGNNTSTKFRRPFILVYTESHLSKVDALRREKYFKTSAGRKAIKLMLRDSISQEFIIPKVENIS